MSRLSQSKVSRIVLVLLLCATFLINCTSPEDRELSNIIIAEVPIVETQPIETIAVSIASTIMSTSTPLPVIVVSPTLTPTSISTPIPPSATPSITPAPTRSVAEEGVFLSQIMVNNGNCKLPCWWGIMPGKTKDQEARDLFASQGIDDWVSSFNGAYRLMNLGYPIPNSPYYSDDVRMQIWVEDTIIQFIDVQGKRRGGEEGELFAQNWQQYSIPEMFKQFGMPTHVTLTEEIPADAGPYFYQLGMSYPSLGIEIRYIISPIILENGEEQICSNFAYIQFIHLLLYVPDQIANAPIDIIPNNLGAYPTWEEITETSIELFYEMFQDDNEARCLLVNP